MIEWNIIIKNNKAEKETSINNISCVDNFNHNVEEYIIDFFENNNAKYYSNVYKFYEAYNGEPYNETNPVKIEYEKNGKMIVISDDYYDAIFDKYYSDKNICCQYRCFNTVNKHCEGCCKKYCLKHIYLIKKCNSCKNIRCVECLKNHNIYKSFDDKKYKLCTRCNNLYLKKNIEM